MAPGVEALQALRGVPCTIAVTTVAELGDLTRFDNPKQLMSDLGLTPAAYSSGERRRQGHITKTGHRHVRRALIEGAWADRDPAKVSRHLQRRLEQLPKPLQDISWRAQVRWCQRDRQWIARGKPANQVVGAMAREVVACMWAMAKPVAMTPETLETHDWCLKPSAGWPHPLEEAPPRYGVTLDGVTRPTGMLVPRVRQAPDGGQSGGTQPTDSSTINRRLCLAPTLPMDIGEKMA
jgi:hypothetical protein